MRQLLAELDDRHWNPSSSSKEWNRSSSAGGPRPLAYFQARRAGRGAHYPPERTHVWSSSSSSPPAWIKLGVETWGQQPNVPPASRSNAPSKIKNPPGAYKDEISGKDPIHRDDSSGMRYLGCRYQHIVVDEAQDLRPAHWKMLRAMADPEQPNDMFVAGDTHRAHLRPPGCAQAPSASTSAVAPPA